MSRDGQFTPAAVDTARNHAMDLHNLSQFGEKAYPFILDVVGALNMDFKGKPEKLREICHIYKQLSKNDPVFANEVQIGDDGSLNFFPNKLSSPQMKELQGKLTADTVQGFNDSKNGLFAQSITDREHVDEDVEALQKEEKHLVQEHKQAHRA